MRTLLATTLLLTLAAALPAPAMATVDACTSATDADCPTLACADLDTSGAYARSECTYPKDHLDTCAFQSDCCGGLLRNPFWCPPDS